MLNVILKRNFSLDRIHLEQKQIHLHAVVIP